MAAFIYAVIRKLRQSFGVLVCPTSILVQKMVRTSLSFWHSSFLLTSGVHLVLVALQPPAAALFNAELQGRIDAGNQHARDVIVVKIGRSRE